MPSLKKYAARKAAKTTARHTVHGAASKLMRTPVRSTSLLLAGALIGFVAGGVLRGRRDSVAA